MTRSQRRFHSRFWLIFGPLIGVGLLLSLSARPPVSISLEAFRKAERAAHDATASESTALESAFTGEKP